MQIRPLVAGDAEALAGLYRVWHAEEQMPPPRFTAAVVLRDGFGPAPRFTGLVAEEGGTLGGLALWHPSYDPSTGRDGAYLLDLFVAPGWRRRGTGRALMQAVAAAVVRQGGRFLFWVANTGNGTALPFYEALGAEVKVPVALMALEDEALGRLAGGD